MPFAGAYWGRIVVALASGEGFRRLATVGRIRELEPLPDGRYNLRLEGLERVWLSEVPADTPYRRVRVEPRPESTGTDDALASATWTSGFRSRTSLAARTNRSR